MAQRLRYEICSKVYSNIVQSLSRPCNEPLEYSIEIGLPVNVISTVHSLTALSTKSRKRGLTLSQTPHSS